MTIPRYSIHDFASGFIEVLLRSVATILQRDFSARGVRCVVKYPPSGWKVQVGEDPYAYPTEAEQAWKAITLIPVYVNIENPPESYEIVFKFYVSLLTPKYMEDFSSTSDIHVSSIYINIIKIRDLVRGLVIKSAEGDEKSLFGFGVYTNSPVWVGEERIDIPSNLGVLARVVEKVILENMRETVGGIQGEADRIRASESFVRWCKKVAKDWIRSVEPVIKKVEGEFKQKVRASGLPTYVLLRLEVSDEQIENAPVSLIFDSTSPHRRNTYLTVPVDVICYLSAWGRDMEKVIVRVNFSLFLSEFRWTTIGVDVSLVAEMESPLSGMKKPKRALFSIPLIEDKEFPLGEGGNVRGRFDKYISSVDELDRLLLNATSNMSPQASQAIVRKFKRFLTETLAYYLKSEGLL